MTFAPARLPLSRLLTRRGVIPTVGWSLLALGAAASSRSAGLGNGADHVLRGTFAVVVLPLLTYGIVSAALGGVGLRPSIRGIVALGGAPHRAALASIAVAMAASAVVCALLATVVCVLAHGASDPPLARDVPASFGVAFAGGAAYAAYFCAGSAIGRGAMRGAFLALDFLVGASAGVGALFTPRSHVVALLGGPTVLDVSRRASSAILAALVIAYLAFALRLARRPAR